MSDKVPFGKSRSAWDESDNGLTIERLPEYVGRAIVMNTLAFFLTILTLSVVGCGGDRQYPSLDPRTAEATLLLLGASDISRDGRSLCFAADQNDQGMIGLWTSDSGRFRWKNVDCGHLFGIQFIHDQRSRRALLCGQVVDYESADASGRVYRNLGIVDLNTLRVLYQYRVPSGPGSWCFVSPDVVMMPCYQDQRKHEGAIRVVAWRMEGQELKEIDEIHLPGREFRGCAIRHVSDAIILLHVWFPQAAQEAGDGEGGPATSREKASGPSEIIVYDLSKHEVLARTPTSVSAWTPGNTVEVAAQGKRVCLLGSNVIELRSLPSLSLLKTVATENSPYHGAVSSDGRYVAFGLSRLELWDTATGEVHLLDKMDEDLIRSPTFRLRWDVAPQDAVWPRIYAQDQYCLARLQFVEDRHELATLTHGGVFSTWDVSRRERLQRVRITDVEYLGGIKEAGGEKGTEKAPVKAGKGGGEISDTMKEPGSPRKVRLGAF
jgi:hypothetical protein